jgi:hypothetical protein
MCDGPFFVTGSLDFWSPPRLGWTLVVKHVILGAVLCAYRVGTIVDYTNKNDDAPISALLKP